jgi:hypothetical protein
MSTTTWKDLSRTQRRAIVAVGVAETVLKAAMLADLRRRPAARVRGPKLLWAASTLVNSAGLIPAVYFLAGRVR